MYIIYRVDNDDGNIVRTPIGVVNGDESVAVRWMSKNNYWRINTIKQMIKIIWKGKVWMRMTLTNIS